MTTMGAQVTSSRRKIQRLLIQMIIMKYEIHLCTLYLEMRIAESRVSNIFPHRIHTFFSLFCPLGLPLQLEGRDEIERPPTYFSDSKMLFSRLEGGGWWRWC